MAESPAWDCGHNFHIHNRLAEHIYSMVS